MSAQQLSGPSETARSDHRKAITIPGAVAGLLGPLLFPVGFVVQGFLRRREYDPIAEPVSAPEAGPDGWIQQLNLMLAARLWQVAQLESQSPDHAGMGGERWTRVTLC
jgi:hypothetical protein